MRIPYMVYANGHGDIFEHDSLKMTMSSGGYNFMPYDNELISLPAGSLLSVISKAVPIGFDMDKSTYVQFNGYSPVSASLPQNYLRLFCPSYETSSTVGDSAYTAVGWADGKFLTAAIKIDEDRPCCSRNELVKEASKALEFLPGNKLIKRVADCSICRGCDTAKQMLCGCGEFLSVCLRCTSTNMSFDTDEIVSAANFYAQNAEKPLITVTDLDNDPIEIIRKLRTGADNVTISVYSGSVSPYMVKNAIHEGADSIVLPLSSPLESVFNKLQSSGFDNLLKSLEIAASAEIYKCLIVDVMPGITDRKSSVDALGKLIKDFNINYLILRNMRKETGSLLLELKPEPEEILGVKNMLRVIKKENKNLQMGAYNRAKEDFNKDSGLPDLKPVKFKKK